MSPKGNETGVIKTFLKYTKVKFLQSNPSPPLNTCAFTFFQDSIHFWKAFSGIVLSSVVAVILMESMSEKWVSFRTDLILGKSKKSQGARLGEYGGVPKLQCSFLQEPDKYSGLCKQECYCDGASIHGLTKGSALLVTH